MPRGFRFSPPACGGEGQGGGRSWSTGRLARWFGGAPPTPRPTPPLRRGRGRRAAPIVAAAAILVIPFGLFAFEVAGRAHLEAPAATPILYDRTGTFLAQLGNEAGAAGGGRRQIEYGYWPLERLPDRVVAATLALEDRRFRSHPGIDPLAIARALRQNFRSGRRVSGASTVAMQVARMQRPGPRTLWSKAAEAGTAAALTLRYGRDAVLAQYLRLVPYGNGSHGIAHAARFYLDKPVADLSWAEIALLSAVPQSPTLMNPLRPDGLARAVRRGHAMLEELGRRGVVTGAELALAHRQLDETAPPRAPRRPEALHALLRFEAMREAGALRPASEADPRITTSLDLGTQAAVVRHARRHLAAWRPYGAEQVAALVIERGTRRVLAALGSTEYGDRRSGAIDFTAVRRSPGSTLKPFIYGLALQRGLIRTSDVLADLPEGASGIGNADGAFLGPMLPRQALANSRNVPAAHLLREIGLETAFRHLRTLGLHDLDVPAETFGLSMAIGSLPTSLDRLVRAYGALAEDGLLGDLVWYAGEPVLPPRRVMSADAARLVTLFLADPLARLPSFPRYGATEFPFAVALKTGTSQGYRDAWLIGWSARYIVGVWVGRGDAGTMSQLSGGRAAARLAHAILEDLHEVRPGDLAETSFPAPEGRVPVELCAIGGQRSTGACGRTLTEWVRPDEVPPIEPPAILRARPEGGERLELVVPAAHRAWARSEGYPLDETAAANGQVRLSVASPEQNTRLWRNPDAPAVANRLALKANVEPRVPQVVWYVDGEPFALTDPDVPVFWPMTPGVHRFQVRLPLRDGASRLVRVVVE
ncbi:MAG: glycosyl transferase family 51 [Enterovirga sp.]|nr:glycosyl transferase family 51 [Enterovirga sp.]